MELVEVIVAMEALSVLPRRRLLPPPPQEAPPAVPVHVAVYENNSDVDCVSELRLHFLGG